MSDAPGAARTIFINGEGELRCGWRLLIFFAAFLFFLNLFAFVVGMMGKLIPALGVIAAGTTSYAPAAERLARSYVDTITALAAVLAASASCARLLERRSFASVGFKLHRGWLRDSALGIALGSISLGLAVGIMVLAGAVSFQTNPGSFVEIATRFAVVFIFFLLAAAFEELLIRGFPFQALMHNLGIIPAIAITSLVFGLLHLANPGATLFSTLNTVLAGVWLGTAYLMTRSLWLATGLHMSWNFAMAFAFGLPVSGLTNFTDLAAVRGTPGSPVWLSGGAYGPEGGAAATVALAISTLVIWKSGLVKTSTEMLSAMRHRSLDSDLPGSDSQQVAPALDE